MKALVTFTALLIFGWVIGVTFYGPQIARAINAPEAKVHRPRSMDSSTNHPTNYQPNE